MNTMQRPLVREFWIVLLTCSSLATARVALRAAEPGAAVLPLKKIVIFNSGVAYFEHRGVIDGSRSVELEFEIEDINDLLKSMVVEDLGGGRISGVSCDSKDPLDRTLQTFAVDLTTEPTVGDLLRQMRGEKVRLETTPAVTGVILGVELRRAAEQDGSVGGIEMLNLLTDDGLRSFPLNEVPGIRLNNAKLDADLRLALATLASGHRSNRRTVRIQFDGKGERPVRVGYVRQSPVWKTSYRLVLRDEKPSWLQGWAIVENTTESDWNDVELILVSGRPVSFVMNLYEPLFVRRPNVPLEVAGSPAPPLHDQDLAQKEADFLRRGFRGDGGFAFGGGGGGFGGGGFGGGLGGFGGGGAPGQAAEDPFGQPFSPEQGVAAQASTADLGVLFQYAIDHPVTVARRRSAMLPIVNQAVDVERLAIYTPSVHSRHPLSGVRLTNSTDVHLMQGPMTIFDKGTYAGDARMKELAPKSRVLISYALDLDVTVKSTTSDGKVEMVGAKIQDNNRLIVDQRQERTLNYTVRNSGEQAKKVILESANLGDSWELIGDPPTETTESFVRFAVDAKPGKEEELERKWVQETSTERFVGKVNNAEIADFFRNDKVPKAVKQVLKTIVDLRREVASLSRKSKEAKAALDVVSKEQERIRKNMEVLNRSAPLYQRYVEKFSKQEAEVERLQMEINEFSVAVQTKSDALAQFNGPGSATDDPFAP